MQTYTQARYACPWCGEYDVIELGRVAMPEARECPRCNVFGLRIALCHGASLDVVPRVGKPGIYTLRLGMQDKGANGAKRGSTARHGNVSAPLCVTCNAAQFNTRAGAKYRQQQLQAQHAAEYSVVRCTKPKGGFHVLPGVFDEDAPADCLGSDD